MISEAAMIEYKKRIDGSIFCAEPGDSVVIENDDGTLLLVPDDETDEAFLAMVMEQERTGSDVFTRKYKPLDEYPDMNAAY